LDSQASSLLHRSLFKDLVRVYIYQTIIMNELGLTFEPEHHDLMSHQILLFVIVQSIF
jgi:hypothetical protein